ncbi:MAG: ABC transporter ATP-binding protein, partial [Streptomyces sp.]
LDPAGAPVAWRHKDATAADVPVRPLRDTDSLLSALNESIAAPSGLVARVDAEGILTGVTSRDEIHDHAGHVHTEASTVDV